MIDRIAPQFCGKHIVFLGAGVSHEALIFAFLARGFAVTVRDRRDDLGDLGTRIAAAGGSMLLGERYLDGLDGDAGVIFRSPGIPYTRPELTAARNRGAAVTSETEAFFAALGKINGTKSYAITGSDGKTTTSTLIAAILRESGRHVMLGGNIGTPLLAQMDDVDEAKATAVVAELSSFQLLSMRQHFDVSVITNVAPNHLDVHRDMEEYVAAKMHIFAHQHAQSRTVLNAEDARTAKFAPLIRGQLCRFSMDGTVENGAFLRGDGMLCLVCNGVVTPVVHRGDVQLPGEHNIANLLAAFAAVDGDANVDAMAQVARDFAGVEHRIEFVRELDGVRYYNDSIATSPTRTIAGLNAFSGRRIVLLAGGYDKHIPFAPMMSALLAHAHTVILTGATADAIEAALRAADGFTESGIEMLRAENMEDSVRLAREAARPGDIVLLSPACASFDRYANFAARGLHFKETVKNLPRLPASRPQA